MNTFYYKATDRMGNPIEGNLEALDYQNAVVQVRGLNYFPIKVSDIKPGKNFSVNNPLQSKGLIRSKLSAKDLVSTTQQLATLIESGITLDKALSILVELAEKPQTKEILSKIHKQVHSGGLFADSLAEFPKTFSNLYINMIRAGEAGGSLAPSLNSISSFLEKSEELKANIRSAMIYPAILTSVGGFAILVLFTVVIPRFSKLFDELGSALPLPTKLMLFLSSSITNHWIAIIIIFILLVSSFVYYLKNKTGRMHWDGIVLRLPLFGPLAQKIEISRFSRTMATLLSSGVAILEALSITKTILNNRVIASTMARCHQGLKEGHGLSQPLKQTGVFPPLAIHMITIGEETGNLEQMMIKVANTYDQEVERSIKQLISLIEPFMILSMALVIGFIVISMLLAIFSINEINF
ncbi:MAG: type II secretion system F family protein [Nitrospinaceae bacterium]|jgi:type II secretion system protein F|tara:strand:+ start:481 stop:1710 length:1230 start_codon:yes stop_codon:yes gene_type:complete